MSSSGSFGSPLLVTSVELVQAETRAFFLKTDVMMTADRCSDLTFCNYICYYFHFKSILYTVIITVL